MSALREMTDCAGAGGEPRVPSIFIADRQGRLRFHRPGFAYNVRMGDAYQPNEPLIEENAPRGRSIEDYLQGILGER